MRVSTSVIDATTNGAAAHCLIRRNLQIEKNDWMKQSFLKCM
jgi:hypothetical protein